MGFYKNLFFPLKSTYKKLNPLTQNRIAFVISLAGSSHGAIERYLFPILESAMNSKISSPIKKSVSTELALGLTAVAKLPAASRLNQIWNLEPELLREIVIMLVLAENNDSRQVLSQTNYSSNPNEAKVQCLLAVSRLINPGDDTLAQRLNTEAFGAEWSGFVTGFIDGSITGFNRTPRATMLESTSNRIADLSSRSKLIIEELINRTSSAKQDLPPQLAIPATQIFLDWFKKIEKRAVLHKIVVREFSPIGRYFAADKLVPFAYGLVCLTKLKDNPDFLKSDEHQKLFSSGVDLLIDLYKESCKFMESQLSPELPSLNFSIGVSGSESEEMQREHILKALNSISSDASVENIDVAKNGLFNWFTAEAKINDEEAQYLAKDL